VPDTAVERVLDADNHLGETPVWSAAEQALYWVNCEQPSALHRWTPATGERQTWATPKRIGGFALKSGGGLVVVLADGIYDLDAASGGITLQARCRRTSPCTRPASIARGVSGRAPTTTTGTPSTAPPAMARSAGSTPAA